MIKNSKMFAEWLHNTYEQLSKEEGWNTQEKTKVEFKNLPKENQRVMLRLAVRIKKQFEMYYGRKALSNSIVPPSNSPTASSHSFGEHNMGLEVSATPTPKEFPKEIPSPNPN